MNKITPFLWFDNNLEEAISFYTSIFKDSKLIRKDLVGDGDNSWLTATFELEGQQFHCINGGPSIKFNEAVSMSIDCASQDEVDYYWDRLAEGGEVIECGWVKDKFGLFWQVTPSILLEMTRSADAGQAQRVFAAMMKMKKIEIEVLQKAYDNE